VLPGLVTAGLFQAAYMGGETLKIKNLFIIENNKARGLLCLRFFTKSVVFNGFLRGQALGLAGEMIGCGQ
jgi:hypothetical protein